MKKFLFVAVIAGGILAAFPLATLLERWLEDAYDDSDMPCNVGERRIDGIEYAVNDNYGSWAVLWRDYDTERMVQYTIYHATIIYDVPADKPRWAVARVLGEDPEQQDRCLENGEIHLRSKNDIRRKKGR